MFDDDEYLHDIPMAPSPPRSSALATDLDGAPADPKLRSVIFEAGKGFKIISSIALRENYRKLGFEMEKPNILTIKGGERTRRNWKNTR